MVLLKSAPAVNTIPPALSTNESDVSSQRSPKRDVKPIVVWKIQVPSMQELVLVAERVSSRTQSVDVVVAAGKIHRLAVDQRGHVAQRHRPPHHHVIRIAAHQLQ